MRKYLRRIARSQAERNGAKASKVVHDIWTRYQIQKYGERQVAVNRAIGTHPKKNWATRIGSI